MKESTMFRNVKLSAKLVTLFLCVGIIPALIIGAVAFVTARKDMRDQKKVTFGTLAAARDIKKAQLETYFAERQGDMGVLVETVATLRQEAFSKLEALRDIKKQQIGDYFNEKVIGVKALTRSRDVTNLLEKLVEYHNAMETKADGKYDVGNAEFTRICDEYGKTVMDYYRDSGVYDVFVISAKHGHVMFSAAKESDLGENLSVGHLKDSGLASAWRRAKSSNSVAMADFEPYAPSGGEPAAFISNPIHGSKGEIISVLAIQVPLDQVNHIMTARSGLGKTGETYLVGQDQLMRSDSFLAPESHSVVASFMNPSKGSVGTEASKAACSGKTDAKVIKDYNGNPVLSAYTSVNVLGVTWGLLAEIDVAEAFCPVDEDGNEYFAKYIEKYGYYDLFLMNPDGYCFYTACREADYQTNLVNGKFSSSNLGSLTREVLQSKEYGLIDFAPYSPSNNAPCGFVAQPVTHGGKVEMIIALQLPMDGINDIMGIRSGMGETGETYLVGSDKRMRSDSFLDQKGHSVEASFAGNVANNGVDTEAATKALAGKTGAEIIRDYNDNPVLSAYAPITVGNTTWAILSEVDEAEAYAGLKALKFILCLIGVITLPSILAISLLLARSMTKPINRIMMNLTEGSEQVTSAAGQVSASSQSLAEGATEQAAGLEETSSSLEEMASMTKQNADNAQQANTLAADARKAADTGNESMGRMNTAIQDIQKSSDETAKIIKVIDEIAFQTNLLALNAAVEAARAGEAGKSFAVVAEEVRNLAMRSAEAAKDTSGMIEESVQNANNGVEIATEVGKVLEEIVEGIGKTTDLVGEIAAASQEQSQGIDQVNTAVSQMDKVTQANAANAEESASASEELSAQAEQMSGIVNELSALVGGSSQGNTGLLASSPRKAFKATDHAFHQIASGAVKTQVSQDDAENAIPLGSNN